MKTLVIVESPTKAKTISKYLGGNFHVESSMGHVRDLPKSKMGVDIEGGTFLPDYEIPASKKKKVSELKKLAKECDDILFATDEDREGEAISWHLAELLHIKPETVKRLLFHEITKTAIEEAIAHPRPLDLHLVDAQQARRVLDRLVGYELSPLLWKKVRYGLSAGRVQSVAVHLIVDREKERALFVSSSYFDLVANLTAKAGAFVARLTAYDGKSLPSGKDFDEKTGVLKSPEQVFLLPEDGAAAMAKKLFDTHPWTVSAVTETPYQSNPYPPFVTSTLQQEGSRKLGLSAKQTMRTAQSLYENGYITYMRTDSVHLSDQAVNAARVAAREFGDEYVAKEPKQFTTKSKSAQEAHEAIRPAGDSFMHPADVAREVTSDEARLYDLIWKRTVASQMKSADMVRMSVMITVEKAEFEAKGKRIAFAGFLRAYVEGADDPNAELEDKEIQLPSLQVAEIVQPTDVLPSDHATQPPARFTEASLIKKLEAEGVGRPSTYATILDTIMEREYVAKQGTALFPTYTAMIVDDFLRTHFTSLVDVGFTSAMEADLDLIALGEKEWQPYIKHFYSNTDDFALHSEVEKSKENPTYPAIVMGSDPESGKHVIIKSGKYGPYIQRGEGGEGNTSSIPESIPPADLTLAKALELLSKPQGPQVVGTDEATGKTITLRNGRYGPYLQLGEDEEGSGSAAGKKAKKVALTYGPKHTPISTTVDIEHLTPDQIKQIITFPRVVGDIAGEKVTASIGRFGPYIKKGDDFRSIPKDKDVLTITIEESTQIFAEEKKGRGRKKATVLKELGIDPTSEKPFQILDGRYGPYISNGTRTFVSVPKDTPPESVTLEQAVALLGAKTPKKTRKKRSTA